MVGRSHAIQWRADHLRLQGGAGWLAETAAQNQERWRAVGDGGGRGARFSGAMGTYANTDPEVEALTLPNGLVWSPTPVSTQVMRPRSGMPTTSRRLALVGTSLERKISTEISHLQRTATCWSGGKLSARARKEARRCHTRRNPFASERISGLAARAAQLHRARPGERGLWHEAGNISHSSVER